MYEEEKNEYQTRQKVTLTTHTTKITTRTHIHNEVDEELDINSDDLFSEDTGDRSEKEE